MYIYIYVNICPRRLRVPGPPSMGGPGSFGGNIWLYMRLYMAIYDHIHPKICILGIWTCILGVWTCIRVPELVFLVSELVFGCLNLYFWCLNLYLGAWTCIWVSELVFLVSELVFGCLDLYLGCLDLYFGFLDLYLCVRTCFLDTVYLQGVCILPGCMYTSRVPVYLWGVCIVVGCDYGVRAPPLSTPWLSWLCRSCLRRFGDLKKTRPWIFWTCILSFLLSFVDLSLPWTIFQKVDNLVKWLC